MSLLARSSSRFKARREQDGRLARLGDALERDHRLVATRVNGFERERILVEQRCEYRLSTAHFALTSRRNGIGGRVNASRPTRRV
jgi:hypothetical protein